MPPKTQARPDTEVIVDRAANRIVMTRKFTAPRGQVFEAWTQPEHVAYWWDASGARLRACEIDLRPGGAFRFIHQGPPDVPPFSGIYCEITPPEKLVFAAMGAVGKVVLEDVAGATLMTVSITCASAAHLDQFLQMGVDAGTSRTLDNLVVYVGSIKR
jgi:uncharacterized protein YndB with AHSA1/START domain